MTIHACPTGPLADLTLPCCGRTIGDLPHGDRIHTDPARVDCGGGES